ncbi:hypothetical protein C8R43DRAFT_953604 [Mycena crocata]|nr:hypothetical protein C8R43DRAFT_953604 [Mycena crocata]
MNFFPRDPSQTVCPTSTDANPDMQGYAVHLSGFTTQLGIGESSGLRVFWIWISIYAAILLAWSDEHTPRFCYAILFSQLLFPLFGTLWTIKRDQLNVQDVQFLIVQLRSPHKDRKAVRSSLFTKIFTRIHRLDWAVLRDRSFATLAVLLFVVLRLIIHFDECAYASSTSPEYSGTQFATQALGALILCTLGIYASAFRHPEERRSLTHTFARRNSALRGTVLFLGRYSLLIQNRALAVHIYPWLPVMYAILFAWWSGQMKIWLVEDGYQFTYGQFLSIAPAVGVLFECLKLLWRRRQDLGSLPRRLVIDVGWLVLGKGKPWVYVDDHGLPRGQVLSAFKTAWDVISHDAGRKIDAPHRVNTPLRRELHSLWCGARRRRLAARRRRGPTRYWRAAIELRHTNWHRHFANNIMLGRRLQIERLLRLARQRRC